MKILLSLVGLAGLGFALHHFTAPTSLTDDHTHADGEEHSHEAGVETHDHDDDMIHKDPAWVTVAPAVSLLPVSHASAVLAWSGKIIYVDPVGDASLYTKFSMPDIVIVTHRHGDHFDQENLPNMLGENTTLITTADVAEQLPDGLAGEVVRVSPGETLEFNPLTLEVVPAYNIRAEAQNFHPQSRGDIGIVLDDGESRVYFSGDTEGTPEMRALENIDVAFVSMNLPYTMDVDAAAEAVLALAPKAVYPYHFRTPDGFSDVERFRELVKATNDQIEVVLLDWYEAASEG